VKLLLAALLLLLVPVVIAALARAPWSFRAAYDREVAAGLHLPSLPPSPLVEADLAHLPPAVRRYLHFAGAVGRPRVRNFRLRFRGALRNGPGSSWMPMQADQQSFVDPPARLFLVEASMLGVPFTAFHRYVGADATFRVRVASLLTIVDARGPEMNRSETVTLLNDMCLLAPATLIDPRIAWEELEPLKVRLTWTNAASTVSAVLTFAESGALLDFLSEDRSRTTDGRTFERLPWSTPVAEWRDFGGRRLPAKGEAIWGSPDGRFAYGRFEILDVAYDVEGRP
jgi:hypothetical protein